MEINTTAEHLAELSGHLPPGVYNARIAVAVDRMEDGTVVIIAGFATSLETGEKRTFELTERLSYENGGEPRKDRIRNKMALVRLDALARAAGGGSVISNEQFIEAVHSKTVKVVVSTRAGDRPGQLWTDYAWAAPDGA